MTKRLNDIVGAFAFAAMLSFLTLSIQVIGIKCAEAFIENDTIPKGAGMNTVVFVALLIDRFAVQLVRIHHAGVRMKAAHIADKTAVFQGVLPISPIASRLSFPMPQTYGLLSKTWQNSRKSARCCGSFIILIRISRGSVRA